MQTREYIQKLKATVPDLDVTVLPVTEGGFRCDYSVSQRGKLHCTLLVPKSKIGLRASLGIRLTLKHEFGHLIFHYLIHNDNIEAKRQLAKIPFWFKVIQKFWYWNPRLRKIRIKLGYSNHLWYGATEVLNGYYRWEHELFADWQAIGRWKGLKSEKDKVEQKT